MIRRLLKIIVALVVVAVLVVGGYVAYVCLNYYRIEDDLTLAVENNQSETLTVGQEYTAATYNIGFGAYTPDFTFFMDEGVMKDGTATCGTESIAASKESVETCTQGDIDLVESLGTDFILLQEADIDSTRSYGIDQQAAFIEAFSSFGSVSAINFHSVYLMYPPTKPHGAVYSGLLTLSKYNIESATRKSYPVSDEFPTKFFDLDRCFSVTRLSVNNGKELVLVNNHMSAYDEGGTIRAQQIAALRSSLEAEYDAGNYVIVGGDWNHALCSSEEMYASEQEVPDWVQTIEDGDFPEGYSVVRAENIEDVATCRGSDIPYEKGVSYEATIDGYVVSDNIDASALNIDNGYLYSDHNPVKLTFTLK